MAVLPSGAPSLPTSVSTQAIFLPSGEMEVCSKRRAAYMVFMTSSRGVAGLGVAAAGGVFFAACCVGFFCCAKRVTWEQKENVRMLATKRFENRMGTGLSNRNGAGQR